MGLLTFTDIDPEFPTFPKPEPAETLGGEIYWAVLEPIWGKVSIYGPQEDFLRQFAGLTPVQQHLFAVHWCHAEVCNGGFYQFFINPTGVLAPEAMAGFQAIGLEGCAGIVETAMAFFGSPYPREQYERSDILAGLDGETREEWDPFYSLNDKFFRLYKVESGGLAVAADTYAARFAIQQTWQRTPDCAPSQAQSLRPSLL